MSRHHGRRHRRRRRSRFDVAATPVTPPTKGTAPADTSGSKASYSNDASHGGRDD
jgi:hypothetical protein